MPIISVIVPIYNPPIELLKECLQSLHKQILQDCEFLLVSDGAPASIIELCSEFKKKDNRFSITLNPHKNVSFARNSGIKQANGDFVIFVDSDDSLDNPEALSTIQQWQNKNLSDVTIFDWNEHKLWPSPKKRLLKKEIDHCLRNCIFIQDLNFSAAPWAKSFNRQFLLSNNILFKENCTLGQDRVFNYEAISKASSISYCPKTIYQYRINDNSATQKYRENMFPILVEYVKELNKIIPSEFSDFIGSETIRNFYRSWDLCYMHPHNKKKISDRIASLKNVLKSDEFKILTNKVNFKPFSPQVRIEIFLYKKNIFLPLWIHGIKHLLFN